MATQNNPQNEEIDLGNLFKVIGKGFSNLFNAIGNFLKGLFHFFILLLIFFRKNAFKLGIAVIIGAIIGFILDTTSPKIYSSTMVVEPNFKSTQQLYNNINFYNELVKQKDTTLLSQLFNISEKEAASLKGFDIEPIKNENEKYEQFNEFIEKVDTTTVKNVDIEEFKKGFTVYDYTYHKIKVKSADNAIFGKLNEPIINSIQSNSYFKNQKLINDQNLVQNEKVLLNSLVQVDTLRKIYNEVLIKEANKAETGTTITLAEGAKKTNELELFEENLKLNRELINNNKERAETAEILNVVSDFNPVGTKERGLFKKNTVLIGLGFGLLMLLIILLKQLGTYLSTYK
ncbi:MAG: hypothetical protein KDC69_11040 [Flavobacteriaceae bacterium]|nr:hypothetical protein [Flavobacteriaceae bacterium]